MKLCKDCRWAVNLFPEATPPRTYDWQCRHPSSQMPAEPPSLVTGEPREPRRLRCEDARLMKKDYDSQRVYCGADGRYWEARAEPPHG
jgi:hypothetical protein